MRSVPVVSASDESNDITDDQRRGIAASDVVGVVQLMSDNAELMTEMAELNAENAELKYAQPSRSLACPVGRPHTCIHACTCLRTCMQAHMCTHACTRARAHTHTGWSKLLGAHVHMHVRERWSVCVRASACLHNGCVRTPSLARLCPCAWCVHACVHGCVHVCICTRTQGCE